MKRVVLREIAHRDIEESLNHYVVEGGTDIGNAFLDDLQLAFLHLGQFPRSGSSRIGMELGLHQVRSWKVGRFPFLVFYIEAEEFVDVWRILHTSRDVPLWLTES